MRPSFFKGAVVGGIAGAAMAAGTVALATTMTFVLGATNSPDAVTAVAAQNKDGFGGINAPMLKLTNSSTGASATPLALNAGPGRPPLAVNSSTKVTKLNADQLDTLDSTSFLRTTGKAADANKLDGRDSTSFASAAESAAIAQPDTVIENADCTDIGGPSVTVNVGPSGLVAVFAQSKIFTPFGTFAIGLFDGASCRQLLSVHNGQGVLATLPGTSEGTVANNNPSWIILTAPPGVQTFSLRATGSGGYGNRSLSVLPL